MADGDPISPPLKPPTDYPGWAERYGPKGHRAGAADLPLAESVAHVGRTVPPQPAAEEPGAAFAAVLPAAEKLPSLEELGAVAVVAAPAASNNGRRQRGKA